jgi:hypothetical protein
MFVCHVCLSICIIVYMSLPVEYICLSHIYVMCVSLSSVSSVDRLSLEYFCLTSIDEYIWLSLISICRVCPSVQNASVSGMSVCQCVCRLRIIECARSPLQVHNVQYCTLFIEISKLCHLVTRRRNVHKKYPSSYCFHRDYFVSENCKTKCRMFTKTKEEKFLLFRETKAYETSENFCEKREFPLLNSFAK